MKLQNLRLYFLILLTSFKRNSKKYIFTFLAILVGLFLITRFSSVLGINSVSEGIIGTYQEHDLPDTVTNLISRGLVKMDKEGRAVSDLSSGWETNNDATEFEFKLKNNLTWVDNTPVRSEDIIFHIPDVNVTYPDSTTIKFQLKESFSAFPSLLTKPIFKKDSLVGIGPYKVSRVEKSVIFITKISLSSRDQKLPNVVLRFYPNEKTAITAFSLGEVASLLGVSNVNDFKNNPQADVTQKLSYSRIVTILYNVTDDVLQNRSLRQALSYSAPSIKDEIEAKTSIAPTSWAYNSSVNDYLGNYEAAKQALTRAKSTINVSDLDKQITLTVTPQLLDVANQVANAWQGLGLKVAVRVEPGIPQNFQVLLITQTIPTDPDQYTLWHSTQTKTNLTKYSTKCCPQSARVDKDLEDGRKAVSEEDRKLKYLDFQRTLLEDTPATFLYFPKYNIVYLKKAKEKLDKVLPLQLNFSNTN